MEPILTLFDSYRDAVWDKDVERLLSLYGPDFRGFEMWGTWSLNGREALRADVKGWFDGLESGENVRVTFSEPRATMGADLLVAEAFVQFAAIAPDGAVIRAMDNRLTWVLRSEPDGWRILHQHTSAPLGDDAAAIFTRPR